MSKSANASGGIDMSVWNVAAAVLGGSFMTQRDATVVSVSPPAIGHDLDPPVAIAQRVIGGYLPAMTLMPPLNGWLVDRIGAKRFCLICFPVFTLAFVLSGAAPSAANASRG